jgi:predicted outer membrane protein
MKQTEYDRDQVEKEIVMGTPVKGEDDMESLDELKTRTEAFFKAPRGYDEAYRKRMHAALDDLLNRIAARNRANDRQRGRP